MTFLAPAFLIGLLGIALPVILHLRRKRSQEALQFPSLMFISKVPYRSLRRRRLQDRMLLALRCLALALLVLAFAQPVLRGTAGERGPESADVLILVDRSYSMAGAERWSTAQRLASEQLDRLGEDDRVSLILFDDRAEVIASDGGGGRDAERVRVAMQTAEPTSATTSFAVGLRAARRQLLDEEAEQARVVIISDFQRNGWLEGRDVSLPPGVELELVDVDAEMDERGNLALLGATLDRDPVAGSAREEITVSARLATLGGEWEEPVRVELAIDDIVVAEQVATLDARGSAEVRFDPFPLESSRLARGVVRAYGDELLVDNEYRFVLSSNDALPLLLVDTNRGGRERSLFAQEALSTARTPRFGIERMTASQVDGAAYDRAAVALVNDSLHELSAERRSELVDFVTDGGGALMVLGSSYRSTQLPSELALDGLDDISQARDGRMLAFVDYSHAVFEPFSQPRSGDFSGARFFRHRAASPRETDRVLARLDDGSPLVVERTLGAGRLVFYLSSLDTYWGTLALQPPFVPWVDLTMRYLAGFAPAQPAYQVRDIARLELDASDQELVLSPPDGSTTPIDEVRIALDTDSSTDGESRPRDTDEVLVEVAQQGFYEIRPVGEDPLVTLAVNVDPVESDPTRLDLEEFRLAVGGPDADLGASVAGETLEDNEPERSSAWWLVLFVGLLVVLAESLFSNRSVPMRAG